MSLSINNKMLLLEGAKVTGTFQEGFYYVEENLKSLCSMGLAELLDFCTWIDDEIGGASKYNIDSLYYCFCNPKDEKSKNFVKEIKNKIQRIKLLSYEFRTCNISV